MPYNKEGFLAQGQIEHTIFNCPQPRIVGRTVVQPETSEIYPPEVSICNYLQSRKVRLDYLDRDTVVEVLGVSGRYKNIRAGLMVDDVDFLEPVLLGRDTAPSLWRIRWPVVDLYDNKKLIEVINAKIRPTDFEKIVKTVMKKEGFPTNNYKEVRQWVGSTLTTSFFGPYPRTFSTEDFVRIARLSVELGSQVINVVERHGVVEMTAPDLFYVSRSTVEILGSIRSKFDLDYFDTESYL